MKWGRRPESIAPKISGSDFSGHDTGTLPPPAVVDNSNIVLYSPYLLRKYRCHIDVEVHAFVGGVKYLCLRRE